MARQLRRVLLDIATAIPHSAEPVSETPRARAQAIASSAANRVALLSAAMSLPPGPFGLVTILPELLGVIRLQAQMVADIAGAYDRHATLSQAAMMHCLFRHAAAQALRDIAVRLGERVLLKRLSQKAATGLVCRLGLSVSRHAVERGVGRVVPLLGAAAAAFFAHADTRQVAIAAIELFEAELLAAAPRRARPVRSRKRRARAARR